MIKTIAACDRNWGIGKDGKLLVSIPADKKYFRALTEGNAVIMGRKTLESLPGGKPLPNRPNIVITTRKDFIVPGAQVVHSPEEAVAAAADTGTKDVFVIGGGEIYKAMLPFCEESLITRIDYAYDADTVFPDLDRDPEWEKTCEGEEQTYFDLVYRFDVYRRVNAGALP